MPNYPPIYPYVPTIITPGGGSDEGRRDKDFWAEKDRCV
jgi:hypothetical protein